MRGLSWAGGLLLGAAYAAADPAGRPPTVISVRRPEPAIPCSGIRKAYKDFEVIRENQLFVPDGPDDRRFALYAPEIQRRLVATGIYKADGTVTLETARRLGWDRTWDRLPKE